MTFPLPGLGYILMSIASALLALRLWQTFKRTGGIIAKFFAYYFFCLIIATSLTALSEILFASNPLLSKLILIPSLVSVQLVGMSFLGYLLFYLIFPQIPARFGFLTVFILGMVGIILYILLPVNPLLSPQGVLRWNPHPLAAIWSFGVILVVSLPLGILLIFKAFSLRPSEGWVNALGLGILCLVGIFAGLFSYIIETEPLRIFFQMGFAIGVLLLTLLTQKPSPAHYVKRV